MPGILRFLIAAATVVTTILLVAGFFGSWSGVSDSLSHFRHVFSAAALLGALISALLGLRRVSSAGIAAVLAGLVLSYPHLPFVGPLEKGGSALRIVQFNVKINNPRTVEAAKWILAQEADVVMLQEYSPENHAGFPALAAALPFEITCKSRGLGSVALRSRHPVLAQHCSMDEGFAWLQLDVKGKPITFAVLHLAWPWPFKQAEHLETLGAALAEMPQPVVLAGDFNATPWSAAVKRVEDLTGSKTVGGMRISLWLDFFHTGKPWPAFPIDHVLLPPFANVGRITLGPDLGSDHLPVMVSFDPGERGGR